MRACQCHQLTKRRKEGTRSHIHICPSPSVTAPIYLQLLLAVIASGIGHFHTARASSRLTSHGCTSCKKSRKHHVPIATDLLRMESYKKSRKKWFNRVCTPRALISTRFLIKLYNFQESPSTVTSSSRPELPARSRSGQWCLNDGSTILFS